MTLVDIIFNYGGEWIKKPNVMYLKKIIDTWTDYDPDLLSFIDIVNEYTKKFGYLGVQQLIVTVPSGNYYEIKALNIYAVDEVGTDCESDNESDDNHVEVEYDSDDLNRIAFQKYRIIDETLLDYKDLCIGMSFKDIPEARLCINLYALVNKRNLKQLKSDPSRLRYECVAGCHFSLLISGDKDMPGVRIKTLKNTHDWHKLQPVRSEIFWKVDPHQAMEPPELVKVVGRPKIKRVRKKDEASKRQGERAISRIGRVMTCNNCGESNHNSKGCKKLVNTRPRKRSRELIDEPEEINLTAPQSTQASPIVNFMSTPIFRQHAPQFSGPRPHSK